MEGKFDLLHTLSTIDKTIFRNDCVKSRGYMDIT